MTNRVTLNRIKGLLPSNSVWTSRLERTDHPLTKRKAEKSLRIRLQHKIHYPSVKWQGWFPDAFWPGHVNSPLESDLHRPAFFYGKGDGNGKKEGILTERELNIAIIHLAVLFCFPIGLYFIWKSKILPAWWKTFVSLMVFFLFIFVGGIMESSVEEEPTEIVTIIESNPTLNTSNSPLQKEETSRMKLKEFNPDPFEWKVYQEMERVLWDPKNADIDEDLLGSQVGKKFNLTRGEVNTIHIKQTVFLQERLKELKPVIEKRITGYGEILEVNLLNANLAVKTKVLSSWNEKTTLREIEDNAVQIIEEGFSFPEIQSVSVWTVTNFIDNYGNESIGKAFSVNVKRGIHQRSNYSNLTASQIIGLFESWYHPLFKNEY